MSEYDVFDTMGCEDAILFKRCVRTLLASTFILADKDEKMYDWIKAESNAYTVALYLRLMGYDLTVKDDLKVAMLTVNEEDQETIGLRRMRPIRFDTNQVAVLMCLWLMYLEKVGTSEAIFIRQGELLDRLKVYDINLSVSVFNTALDLFKRYSLIDYSKTQMRNEKEDAPIRLYPSLQFCMDLTQFKTVVQSLQDPSGTSDEEEGEEDDDE